MDNDLISRSEVIKTLDNIEIGKFNRVSVIETIKSISPIEPLQGEWIDTWSGQECSICKEIQHGYDSFRHFCPNCGAKMTQG